MFGLGKDANLNLAERIADSLPTIGVFGSSLEGNPVLSPSNPANSKC